MENLPGDISLQLLREISRVLEENRIQHANFGDRIIFMSICITTSITEQTKIQQFVIRILWKVTTYAKRFLKEHWSFLGPGAEEKLYGTHIFKPTVRGTILWR